MKLAVFNRIIRKINRLTVLVTECTLYNLCSTWRCPEKTVIAGLSISKGRGWRLIGVWLEPLIWHRQCCRLLPTPAWTTSLLAPEAAELDDKAVPLQSWRVHIAALVVTLAMLLCVTKCRFIVVIIFWPGKTHGPWWYKNYRNYKICLVVINNNIVQLNRVKMLHHIGNPLE